MEPHISYIGDTTCKLATVVPNDRNALIQATQELMNPDSGVSGVRIVQYIAPDEVISLVEETRKIMTKRLDSTSIHTSLNTLGIAHQSSLGIDHYFQAAERWRQDPVFMKTVGPESELLKRTMRTLQSGFGVALSAAKQDGAELLPATVRSIDVAPLHKDVIAEYVVWEISRLQNDISWNIYLRMPEKGGELLLYPPATADCRKEVEMERFTPLKVECTPGDLIFFRSRIPHAVERSHELGKRLTVSGCVAFEPHPAQGGFYWA